MTIAKKTIRERAFSRPSPWLDREEAAARAKVAPSTIDRWEKAKKIKAYRVKDAGKKAGITRYKVAELDALIEGGEGSK